MKTITTILLTLLLTFGASLQAKNKTSHEPRTKMEAFWTRSGQVIADGYQSVDPEIELKSVISQAIKVEIRELVDPFSDNVQYGLSVEVRDTDEEFGDSATSDVDYDEIESLLQALAYMSKYDSSATFLGSFRVKYRTKGDLEISIAKSEEKISVVMRTGYFEGDLSDFNFAILDMSEFEEFKNLIVKAKGLIEEAMQKRQLSE